MKKLSLLLISILLILCCCCCSGEKQTAIDCLESYLNSLSQLDYDTANSLVVSGDDSIDAKIYKNNANDIILKHLSFELTNIDANDDVTNIDIIIHQLTMSKVFVDTLSDYTAYTNDAQSVGKNYSETSLKQKWDEYFVKNLNSAVQESIFPCTVSVVLSDGSYKIKMSTELKNAIFGGEYDFITNKEVTR